MTDLLNSRAARAIAWTIVALLALAAVTFAGFLLWPAITQRGGSGGRALTEATLAAGGADRGRGGAATRPTIEAVAGTVDQVQGRALLVRTGADMPARVVLAADARVALLSSTSDPAIIPDGAEVILGLRVPQQDGSISTSGLILGSVDEFQAVTGADLRATDAAVEFCRAGRATVLGPRRLRVVSTCGIQTVELAPGAQIIRFTQLAVANLRAGQRVQVQGERLVDGSLIGRSVSVIEMR